MPAQCIWKLSDRQDLTDERNDVRTAFFMGKIMMQKQFMVTQGKEKLRFQQIVRLKGNKIQWKQTGNSNEINLPKERNQLKYSTVIQITQ